MDAYSDPSALFGHIPGFPIPKLITITEARAQQNRRATQLFTHFHSLQAIIDRHEATIQKRWSKKRPDQRQSLLKSVWPEISAKHRPDWAAHWRETPQQRHSSGTAYRNAYLWPYLNLEDLSNPKSLLLLIKSRGRNPPEVFATLDCESIHFAITSQAVLPLFLNEYTALLRGSTPKEYGRIYSWDDHEDAFDWLTSRVGMNPGECLLVLEIQEHLLEFLVKCCEAVLHDVPKAKLLQTDIKPEPGLEVGDKSEWPKLSVIRLEKPYQVPGSLEIDRLHLLLRGRITAAHDHLHSLREDPGYFENFVFEWSEHRQEMLLDKYGQQHPSFQSSSANKIFWDRVIGSVMANAFNGVFLWQIADNLLRELGQAIRATTKRLKVGNALPEPIVQPFRNLQRFLVHIRQTYGQILTIGFTSAPELRKYCEREPQDPNSSIIKVAIKQSKGNDLLSLFKLLQDSNEVHLVGFSNIMDEIQRLIDSDSKQRALVSSWLAMVFGELAIVGELTRQLESFEPWASQIEALSTAETSKLTDANVIKALKPFAACLPAMEEKKLGQPYFLDGHKFDYPAEKKRTELVVKRMCQSESNLDDFWAQVEKGFQARGTSLQEMMKDFVEIRPVQRTLPWTPPEQRPLSKEQESPLDEKLNRLDLERRTENTVSNERPQLPKEKQKTKGVPSITKSTAAAPAPEQTTVVQKEMQYAVGKRAFKVLSSLFYDPDASDAPSEIPWMDFVSAMAAMDFRIQKLYGSIWQFTPTKLDVEQSIQFHEPHPVAKIPPWTARRMGRRLNRHYGWTNQTFVRKSE